MDHRDGMMNAKEGCNMEEKMLSLEEIHAELIEQLRDIVAI